MSTSIVWTKYGRRMLFVILTTGGASCISLIGGIGIEAVQAQLLPLVPLLIAMPALNTMVGDYAAIIAAHAGDPAEGKHTKKVLSRAIFKAMWVNIIGIIILSILIAGRRGYLFTNMFLLKFIVFIALAMIGVVGVMFAITIILDKALEKRKLNPDDILIPIVTTITDVLMLGLIALAAVFLF